MGTLLRISVCSLLLVIVVAAADFSGKWKGGIINTLPSGETRQTQEIYMEFSQQGSKVSGTIGPSTDKQFPIDEGKVEGDRLKILQGNRILELTMSRERLLGTYRHTHDSTDSVARLELERVKQ